MLSGYTSYALFSDTIISGNTINLKVGKKRYYKENTLNYTIEDQVKKTAISYKYINDANKTENGITYNNNDNGIFLYNGTDDNGGEYPIYYYRGNVTNNNVLFANMCWKIVRTTSTGGTKLIYNGLPTIFYENTEKLNESSYVVTTNTPTTYPFTFDSSTKEWSSGIAGQASTTNTIEFTVTEAGDYVLNYTVGSEANYDKVSFYKNGTALASNISGANKKGTLDLAGLTTSDVIKVTYTKDSSGDANGDKVSFSIGKLIGEKITSCNNTGEASQLSSTSKFNTNWSSPADVGYMYGTRYTRSIEDMSSSDWYSLAGYSRSNLSIINSKSSMSSTSYYYGDSVTYSDGTYTLNNAEQHTWSTDYSNLKGYYTFFNSNTSGTSKPSYIVGSTSSNASYTTYGSEKLGMGKNVTYSNGTYTITDYTLVDKKDYYSSPGSYKGYYICSNNSNSCSSIRYIDSTSNTRYYYVTLSNGKTYASIIEDFENNPWLYGNDVTYSNGTYTLITTKTSNPLDWSTDRTTLANGYHYTCLNSTGTCTEVYYIYYFGDSSSMYYLTFTEGDNLDSAKTKMFTNTNNSTIKTAIDNWYSTNLTDYTSYLENTIFCNDRTDATSSPYKGPLASKDTNNIDNRSYFKSYENMRNGTPSLECSNINDRFSLKVESGGTNGYGNNTLTYPVGLLTYDEAELAGGQYSVNNSNYYLYAGNRYWLLSPCDWGDNDAFAGVVGDGGSLGAWFADDSLGVRPVVSLASGTEFEEGIGTTSDPYVIAE